MGQIYLVSYFCKWKLIENHPSQFLYILLWVAAFMLKCQRLRAGEKGQQLRILALAADLSWSLSIHVGQLTTTPALGDQTSFSSLCYTNNNKIFVESLDVKDLCNTCTYVISETFKTQPQMLSYSLGIDQTKQSSLTHWREHGLQSQIELRWELGTRRASEAYFSLIVMGLT